MYVYILYTMGRLITAWFIGSNIHLSTFFFKTKSDW